MTQKETDSSSSSSEIYFCIVFDYLSLNYIRIICFSVPKIIGMIGFEHFSWLFVHFLIFGDCFTLMCDHR